MSNKLDLELTQYASISNVNTASTQETTIHGGRCYECLSRGKRVSSQCAKIAKSCSSLLLYGQPYPPLSNRQVLKNYGKAALGLTACGGFGSMALYGIILEATTSLPKSVISPGEMIAFYASIESLALAAGAVGLRIIYKTWHAPREGAGQALLPPR